MIGNVAMIKVVTVVGARPNFMKAAPLLKEFAKYPAEIQSILCHTGQHYDYEMSEVFFSDLKMPQPDFYLHVGSGSHTYQTSKAMIAFEEVLLTTSPDLVIVVGDVNSTFAAALTAVRLDIRVAHVEAGLRSNDLKMPEEISRLLTDRISDYLFVTEKSGIENLLHEGIPEQKIHFVGNTMIDSLVTFLPKAESSNILYDLALTKGEYILYTVHRPSNTDNFQNLTKITKIVEELSRSKKIVFPIHPRTEKKLKEFNITSIHSNKNVIHCPPMGYLDFIKLQKNSFCVITDSGGIQEETTYLGIPCITMRDSTERPITVEIGTNFITDCNLEVIIHQFNNLLNGIHKKNLIPQFWDGKAAERITQILFPDLKKTKKN